MIRIKAIVSYDGSMFYGFQRQKNSIATVAGEIESALRGLKINCTVVGAGRTDRGVHATGQVVHFDVPQYWADANRLMLELNRKLDGIKIKRVEVVDKDFHARFGAKSREYKYCFTTNKQTIFCANYIAKYSDFDEKRLNMTLKMFEGRHDFALFYKSGSDVDSTVRTIMSCRYKKYKNINIITIKADGFLRSQVRMIVDMALKCAMNDYDFRDVQNQIECKNKVSTKLAPACGLYLTKVIY